MVINGISVDQPTAHTTISTEDLKSRLTTLKGWLTRKHIQIHNAPIKGSEMVVYDTPHGKQIAYYMSPGGLRDSKTVRKYFETKAKLDYYGF